MSVRVLALFVVAFAISGCAQKTVFLRIDGQPIGPNPILAQQFEVDRAICAGAREQANLSGVTFAGGGFAGVAAAVDRQRSADTVAGGCMAQRGYLGVVEDQAAAKQAQLAEVDAERRRQEAIAAAPSASPVRAKPKTPQAGT